MSILITGGSGFIGSHTVVEFLNAGYDLVLLDNFSNSKPCVLDRIRKITGKDFKFYEADLLDYDAVEKIFKENNITAVVHFAGYKAVGESVKKPLMYYKNNLDSTLTLCEVMNEYNVKKLVFSSSATVYGKPSSLPIKEDFPLSTSNPYGSTKLFIEYMLKDLFKADNTWNIAILRYFNPSGAHKSGIIGEDPKGIPNNLMPYITQVAVGKRPGVQLGLGHFSHGGAGKQHHGSQQERKELPADRHGQTQKRSKCRHQDRALFHHTMVHITASGPERREEYH